jgi:hypothetical protein
MTTIGAMSQNECVIGLTSRRAKILIDFGFGREIQGAIDHPTSYHAEPRCDRLGHRVRHSSKRVSGVLGPQEHPRVEGERLEDGFLRGEPQHRELLDRNKRVLTVALIDERGRFTGGTRRPVAPQQKGLGCDNGDCPVHTEALYGTESLPLIVDPTVRVDIPGR